MNAPVIIRRMLWKEYRGARAFWLAICVGSYGMLALVALRYANDRASLGTVVVGCALSFYVIGAAAMLFAREREEETEAFLTLLPSRGLSMLVGKLAWLLLSTLTLWCALAPAIFLWMVADPTHHDLPDQFINNSLITFAHVAVWGLFSSLVFTNTLRAALMAGLLSYGSPFLVGPIIYWGFSRFYPDKRYMDSLPVWGIVAFDMLALAICAPLAMVWPRSGAKIAWNAARSTLESSNVASWSARIAIAAPSQLREQFTRLLWQGARQSAVGHAIHVGLLALAWFALYGSYVRTREPAWLFRGVLVVVWQMAAVGAMAFGGDLERNSHRFFIDRGISPRLVWCARQVVSLTLVVALAIGWSAIGQRILGFPVWTLMAQDTAFSSVTPFVDLARDPANWLAFCLLSYSVTQFLTVATRSRMIAAGVGGMLSMGLLGLFGFLHYVGVEPGWLPPAVIACSLAASFIRTTVWIDGRRARRWVAASWLLAALPLAAAAYHVPVTRMNIVGDVALDRPADWTREPSVEGLRTADMYLAISQDLRRHTLMAAMTPRGERLVGTWENSIDADVRAKAAASLMLVTQEAVCALPTYEGAFGVVHRTFMLDLWSLLKWDARRRMDKGQLDWALERYLAALRMANHARQRAVDTLVANEIELGVLEELRRWAAAKEQSPELIAKAFDPMFEIFRATPSGAESILLEHQGIVDLIEGRSDDVNWMLGATVNLGTAERQLQVWLNSQEGWAAAFPWERTRSLRVLGFLTELNLLTAVGSSDVRLWRYGQFEPWRRIASQLGDRSLSLHESGSEGMRQARRLTPTQLRTTLYLPADFEVRGVFRRRAYLDREVVRRATLLTLALWRHKSEHGEWPTNIDEALPKTEDQPSLAELFGHHSVATDPWSGQPFEFLRDGVELKMPVLIDVQAERALESRVDHARPLLWCPGERVRGWVEMSGFSPPKEVESAWGGGAIVEGFPLPTDPPRQAVNELEVFQAGLTFFLE